MSTLHRQTDAEAGHLPRGHQRVDGFARVRFTWSDGATSIADLYQRAPCRLLFPDSEASDFPLAVSLTTSGGLTGGDRVAVELSIGEGACGSVVTQAAEKLYRVLPGELPISIETRIEIEAGGRGEWLAQEAILFDRTAMRRSTEARLSGNARLLAAESFVLGRIAMGERYETGLLHDRWRIWRDGRLVWADGLHLEGDITGLNALPWGMEDAVACATVIYAGPEAADLVALARDVCTLPAAGATCVNGLLVLRLMDADPRRLRTVLQSAIGALRSAAFGLSPRLPAVWNC